MRDHDPASEAAFFACFEAYLNVERTPGWKDAVGAYSLARMLPLARIAENPERALKVIHVAGTKGKGSTCHFISTLLRDAGWRVGLFTSPHLATVRERFQLDNELVSYDCLLDLARRFEATIRQAGLEPTFFEIITVMALMLFRDAGCQFAVLETGIGGRLDATNYIPDPACCAITPVSFDHVELLGNSITRIAAEKAGILKKGVPAVLAPQPFAQAERTIRERARECGAPLLLPAPETVIPQFSVTGMVPFQKTNFRVALAVGETVLGPLRPYAFAPPLVRGRCECRSTDPLIIIDGAHNAHSAAALCEALQSRYPDTAFTVVLGVAAGKDAAGIVDAISPVAARLVLTNPRSPKGSGLTALETCARNRSIPFDVVPDIRTLDDIPAPPPYLFTGSFFTALIGEGFAAPVP